MIYRDDITYNKSERRAHISTNIIKSFSSHDKLTTTKEMYSNTKIQQHNQWLGMM